MPKRIQEPDCNHRRRVDGLVSGIAIAQPRAGRSQRIRFYAALFALVCLLAAPDTRATEIASPLSIVAGAKAAPSAEKTELTVAVIAARRDVLQKEIAATRLELAKLPEGSTEDTARWLTAETALMERIDAILAEQARTWQEAADLAIEVTDITERTSNRRPPETTFKPPYDMAALDQLYAERDALDLAATTLKRDLVNAETMLREAADILGEKDRVRRAVRGAADAPKPADVAPSNLRLAALESRLAQATLAVREEALKILKTRQSLLEPKRLILNPRFDWLRANLILGAEPSTEGPSLRAGELDHDIARAKLSADAATSVVIATERRAAHEQITDELTARRDDRQTANLTLSVLTAQRERIAELAKLTVLRHQVLTGGMPVEKLRVLSKENQTLLEQLTREQRRGVTALFRNQRELQIWQSRLTQEAASATPVAPWIFDRVKSLAAWIDLSQVELADHDRLRIECSRLQEELGSRVTQFSWSEKSDAAWEKLVAAWKFEAFSVQDQPVRVNTIVWVLLLVVLGFYASHWLTSQLSIRILKRFGMTTGRRAALQALWFYALFITVLVVAFHLFHLSLTQFSVVSGALAVGIGFGSQNLIGNFISGIILLIERPVSQGDVIELDGRQVTVERLGPRSTIVRTLDNTHMILPNSLLLDRPVINWTLSDEVVRRSIKVGVAYGSPSRKVEELLQKVLGSVESVKLEPKPLVMFSEFGESSLDFQIFFWVTIEDRIETENELRHRIAEAFAEAEITIAFPQRDVHLETSKPLQVVLTAPSDPVARRSNDGVPEKGS